MTTTRKRLLFCVLVVVVGIQRYRSTLNTISPGECSEGKLVGGKCERRRPPVVVEKDDIIYQDGWVAPAIVIESHKLVFLSIAKNGGSAWKQLFRRMMGYQDWLEGDPHDPANNGLKYLSHYSTARATEIMNDPSWTKAVFVRDPKERLVSAYIDKAMGNRGNLIRQACCKDGSCVEQARSFPGFINVTLSLCSDNIHWKPQSHFVDTKFLHLFQFVGHMETAASDAERLLKRIGAWEEYGRHGWGEEGRIFAGKGTIPHATSKNAEDSWSRLPRYYTPSIESWVESIYQEDYTNPKFNLTMRKISF